MKNEMPPIIGKCIHQKVLKYWLFVKGIILAPCPIPKPKMNSKWITFLKTETIKY